LDSNRLLGPTPAFPKFCFLHSIRHRHQLGSVHFELTKWMFKDRMGTMTPLWVKTWELSKAMYYNKGKLTYKEAKKVYDEN